MSMFGAVDLSTLVPKQSGHAAGTSVTAGPDASGEGLPAPLIVDVTASSLRDVAEVSTQVPVVLAFYAPRSESSTALVEMLTRLVQEYDGRFELGRVDADQATEVAQALQVQAVPAVVALLAGQPVPIFQGAIPEAELRGVLDQLLQLAAQHGVTGRISVGAPAQEEREETEVERDAREAIERGDWAGAEAVYDRAIAQSPGDSELKVARAQVRTLARMDGQDPEALLAAADADPADLDKALAAADAALALGDLEDSLARALGAVGSHSGPEREQARLRTLELFDVIGTGTPEVAAARRRLAALLF